MLLASHDVSRRQRDSQLPSGKHQFSCERTLCKDAAELQRYPDFTLDICSNLDTFCRGTRKLQK